MIAYNTRLSEEDVKKITEMVHSMKLGTLSVLAGYSLSNPERNPIAILFPIMLDIDEYGSWDHVTIGEFLGLIAQCREGRYLNGEYYRPTRFYDDYPFKFSLHTLANVLESAGNESPLIRLFCNIGYDQYYSCVTAETCSSKLVGFEKTPSLLQVIKGYLDFVRAGYRFWKDENNYYKTTADIHLGNIYKFLVEPVLKSESDQAKNYLNPNTIKDVIMTRNDKGDTNYGKE